PPPQLNTLALHDALPISLPGHRPPPIEPQVPGPRRAPDRRRGTPPGQGNPGLSPNRSWRLPSEVLEAVHHLFGLVDLPDEDEPVDRKSTRLNSSHGSTSY